MNKRVDHTKRLLAKINKNCAKSKMDSVGCGDGRCVYGWIHAQYFQVLKVFELLVGRC